MLLFKKTDKLLNHNEITAWLRALRGRPYNPSSNFDVTAVFRVKYNEDETYYFAGGNVENVEHRLSTHAEEGCISAMVTALGKGAEIVEGWVMGAPNHLKPGDKDPLASNHVTCCGKCRQQNMGFSAPTAVIHSVSLNDTATHTTTGEALPQAFSFRDFAPELNDTSLIVTKPLPENGIESKLIRLGKELSEAEILAWLHSLESIDYATKTGQAVVLKLAENQYVAGVKIEDAAYVSINPVQCALAIASVAYNKIAVEEVWTISNKRVSEEKSVLRQFNDYKFNKNPKPLTLGAIQVLAEFARDDKIRINMLDRSGQKLTIPLLECGHHIPKFSKEKMPERFTQRFGIN